MSDIKVHAEAGVMTITLNRLERKNSITSAMYAMLADAIHAAQEDANVRVAVLQGHETVFSAGNDIGDFLNQPPAGRTRRCSASCAASRAFPSPCWRPCADRPWA
jgi:enoyl-CoA hydratase/carnithine racemase